MMRFWLIIMEIGFPMGIFIVDVGSMVVGEREEEGQSNQDTMFGKMGIASLALFGYLAKDL